MAKKQYNVVTKARTARPRRKRGGEDNEGGSGSSVNVIVQGGGSSASSDPNSHTHPNKALLDSFEIDALGYLCTRLKEEGASESTLQRIKAGFADVARTLSEDSPVWNKFLRKDQPDSTKFLISFLDGAVFGEEGFITGLMGKGAKIDKRGFGEMRGLRLWESLEVPELRYNRVEVYMGIKWRVPGAGIIESVTPSTTDPTTGSCTLKLEGNEIGAVSVDDIALGIWHFGDGRDSTEDSDDGKGTFRFAGFATSYFRITGVSGDHNQNFTYQLREGYTIHPQPQMHFACYGNRSKKDRQTCVYETRTYTRMIWNQKTWDIKAANIAMQLGDLSGLNINGQVLTGYSAYLNSVYFTGTMTQTKPNGEVIKVANDRGEWTEGTTADYYDRFSYEGGLWLCIAEGGTTTPPTEDNPSVWLKQVSSGDSLSSFSGWKSENTPYPANAMLSFANRVVISKKATSQPPYPLLTDHNGNYITQSDGSYILYSEKVNSDWDELLDISGIQDGADGASLEVRYSSDKSSWHTTFVEGDIWMQQKLGDGDWSNAMRIVGEVKDGPYSDFQFAVNDSLTIAPASDWRDAPPAVGEGQYLWMRTGVVVPPATEPNEWNVVRIGGEKGDGYTQLGHWRTGMTVPYMGVVTMGGSSWSCKVKGGTKLPPMFTLTDQNGNRLINVDGSYLLTGEINSTEYELLAKKGEDGKDGKDGTNGTNGKDGKDGKDGKQGLQGCVTRHSEFKLNTEYRNDLDESKYGSNPVRYIDFVLRPNKNNATGWDVYRCITKTSGFIAKSYPENDPTNWQKDLGVNVSSIYTSFLLAKNANIKFLSGSQMVSLDDNGNAIAGMTGGDISFWAGSQTPEEGLFKVTKSGRLTATDAIITGEINATSGTIAGFNISSNGLNANHYFYPTYGDPQIDGTFEIKTGSAPKLIMKSMNGKYELQLGDDHGVAIKAKGLIYAIGEDNLKLTIGMKKFLNEKFTRCYISAPYMPHAQHVPAGVDYKVMYRYTEDGKGCFYIA